MGKPQYKNAAHVISHYLSEIMDIVETHTDTDADISLSDIEDEVRYLLPKMVKDSERINKKQEATDER